MHNWRDHDDPTTPAKYTCTKGSTQVTVNSEKLMTLTVYSKATESNHESLSFARLNSVDFILKDHMASGGVCWQEI